MYKFDAKTVKNEIVWWIRQWFAANGRDCNAVVGISGGKDSSVVAALCVEALGKERVIGVLMPNLKQADIDDSYKLCDFLGIRRFIVPITMPVADIEAQLRNSGVVPTAQASINLPARIRMATLYAVSQSLNGRVANTCNLSEDWIGYSTRWGDSVGDLCPISNLTVTEVRAIGHELGLPAELVDKTPSDGLCGKTDEDNLGFTYAALDAFIRDGIAPDDETHEKIERLHNANLFKMHMPESYSSAADDQWRAWRNMTSAIADDTFSCGSHRCPPIAYIGGEDDDREFADQELQRSAMMNAIIRQSKGATGDE